MRWANRSGPTGARADELETASRGRPPEASGTVDDGTSATAPGGCLARADVDDSGTAAGSTRERPTEVCYLINHLAPDGAPSVVESLVAETPADDVSFTVCFFGGDGSLQESMERAGARVVDFGAATDYPQFDPRSLPSMVAFFARESFDVLHCHLPYAQSLGRVVGRLADVDHVVSTQHNVPSNYHPVERLAERATRRLDSATVAVSGGVESAFTGENPSRHTDGGRWCTIQNGIDVDAFAAAVDDSGPESVRERWGVEDADPLFVNVARYDPEKGQHTLIAAMEDVVETLPSAHLLVVGWGALESDLRAAVSDRGLTESVTVTGRVPDIHGYYAAADVFVSASTTEGLPVTLLEAMSASRPVVATDIPGVQEVVVEGETGALVPTDTPDELADAMVETAEPGRREAFGENGFRCVRDQFSVESMVADHLALYRGLVAD